VSFVRFRAASPIGIFKALTFLYRFRLRNKENYIYHSKQLDNWIYGVFKHFLKLKSPSESKS
jgi:hypothetical protein